MPVLAIRHIASSSSRRASGAGVIRDARGRPRSGSRAVLKTNRKCRPRHRLHDQRVRLALLQIAGIAWWAIALTYALVQMNDRYGRRLRDKRCWPLTRDWRWRRDKATWRRHAKLRRCSWTGRQNSLGPALRTVRHPWQSSAGDLAKPKIARAAYPLLTCSRPAIPCICNWLISLARPSGREPATHCLEGSCSIR
jgi:hypothetical protein